MWHLSELHPPPAEGRRVLSPRVQRFLCSAALAACFLFVLGILAFTK